MGKRKPETREWGAVEVEFIEGEARKPRPMGAFYSYCNMQASFAAQDGFPEFQARILAAREVRQ